MPEVRGGFSMRAPNSTCACSRWLLAAFLGGLGLVLAAPGDSRGEDPPAKKPAPQEGAAAKTPPKEPPLAARPDATFLGTRASGKRFCIIADASNSMRGAPLTQLKKEILLTLDGLSPGSQFYIIFFN